MTQAGFSIFAYTDWQAFLREWIELNRNIDPSLTLQSISLRLGLRARSHLHRLLNEPGKTLALHLVDPLARIMNLDAAQSEYWRSMVAMSRARTPEDRGVQYMRMHKVQMSRKANDLGPDMSEYFSAWYLPVLREVVELAGYTGDAAKLVRWFDPAVTEVQIKRGVELLVRLGLLQCNEQGKYVQSDPLVHTKSHGQELAVSRFQHEMMLLGERALNGLERDKREISTVTFTIPRSAFGRMQKVLQDFQETLARESMAAQGIHDSVYQFNLQCFPVAKRPGREK